VAYPTQFIMDVHSFQFMLVVSRVAVILPDNALVAIGGSAKNFQ
jgi:hypothetical protein